MEHKIEYNGGDLRFYVYEGERVVQFVCLLGFGLRASYVIEYPRGIDLGYHSPEPMYEGHTPMEGDCSWTNGPCYYDGTSLGAAEPMSILQDQGEKKLFSFLEAHWRGVFERKETGGFGEIISAIGDAVSKRDEELRAAEGEGE